MTAVFAFGQLIIQPHSYCMLCKQSWFCVWTVAASSTQFSFLVGTFVHLQWRFPSAVVLTTLALIFLFYILSKCICWGVCCAHLNSCLVMSRRGIIGYVYKSCEPFASGRVLVPAAKEVSQLKCQISHRRHPISRCRYQISHWRHQISHSITWRDSHIIKAIRRFAVCS